MFIIKYKFILLLLNIMYSFINKTVKKEFKKIKPINNQIHPSLNNINLPSTVSKCGSNTISLFSQPYLDTYNHCYKNIVVVNLMPKGPLEKLVRFVKFPPLSEYKQPGPCSPLKQCGLALISLNNSGCCSGKCGSNLMVVDEIPTLISFLVSNSYTIDTSITKMLNDSDIKFDTNTGNKLICFITYNEHMDL